MSSFRNVRSLVRTKRSAEWPASVTIRVATDTDRPALRRLAVLDEQPPLEGDALVAEVGGELWAAAAIEHAGVIADPFRPSGELALLLSDRARRIGRARRPRRGDRAARRMLGQAA